ncbi:hypothetical protein JDV02_009627 [Purpureocillium takamizusanense]|uniref:AAA+ ATPase domain-containing protein n=1 Tax=Purpureocillium takamizusanense TaxID=2060973 RepID=A0A9Q8QP81_9HYPO|nr:uncharacterized protein JDV02_009627 [Purpureocillium takamizusanense]UNI23833.1 hypothetical protein JDV02_009627 [Purpureocillium takamizusanense]
MFLQYWRPRTLEQLSGFGFHARDDKPLYVVGLQELVQKIEGLYNEEIGNARRLIEGGLIAFEGLGELYQTGTPFQATTALGGAAAAFFVTDSYYEEHRALLGTQQTFHVTMQFVATMGDHFTLVTFTQVLSSWTGVRARPLSSLTYVPVDSVTRQVLQNRGDIYTRYGVAGAKFLAYAPHTFFIHRTSSFGGQGNTTLPKPRTSQMPSGGRIMIDVARASNMGYQAAMGADEPTLALSNAIGLHKRWQSRKTTKSAPVPDTLSIWETVPSELAMYCWPALAGFSFTAKAWGQVLVEGLEPVTFRDEAFENLVLAEERKRLIRALVRFGASSGVDDLVSGKSGSSIFLLHGPPGVGKTLTVEAIAELIHLPLYIVTMGELGATAQSLEDRLGEILELCSEWNALMLLDEADIFVEKRTTADLTRNAMVCVMLRLLEYHPGILFLTTNRVQSLDPAVESRVTVALRYEPLSVDARVQIWETLLRRTSLPRGADVNVERLGEYAMNGREIKNVVRLSVALATERSCQTLTQQILEETLRTTFLGRQEMTEERVG